MTKVAVTLLDGSVEKFETSEQMQLNGPVLLIGQGGGSYVAFCLAQVRKWDVEASKIAVAGAMPPGLGPAVKQ